MERKTGVNHAGGSWTSLFMNQVNKHGNIEALWTLTYSTNKAKSNKLVFVTNQVKVCSKREKLKITSSSWKCLSPFKQMFVLLSVLSSPSSNTETEIPRKFYSEWIMFSPHRACTNSERVSVHENDNLWFCRDQPENMQLAYLINSFLKYDCNILNINFFELRMYSV